MRKYFVMVMAVCAISFYSCGNKSAQAEATAEETETVAGVDVADATTELAAQLEAGDVNKFQEALTAAQAKVAELLENDPEQAKEYLEKIQNYLKENAEKIQALAGDNQLVSTAVSALVETPAENFISNLKSVVGSAQDSASAAVDAAAQAAADKVDEAKKAAEEQVDAAKKAAQDKADETKKAAADKVNDAASKVNDKVNEGADKLLKGAGLK